MALHAPIWQSSLAMLQGFKESISAITSPRLPAQAFKNPPLAFQASKKGLMLASLCVNLAALALPVMTLQVYDRLLVSQNISTLSVLAWGVAVFVLVEMILRLTRAYILGWAGAVYEHTLSCNALRHILAADMSHVHAIGTVNQLQRMSNIARLREFFSGQAVVTMMDLPFVLVFLALVTWLGGLLVLVPLVIITLFVGLALGAVHRLRLIIDHKEESETSRLGFIIEALEGMHTIKSMGLEEFFQRRFEAHQEQASRLNFKRAKLNAFLVNDGVVFTQLMTMSVIAFGAILALHGAMTLGALIACVLLCARMMQPIQRAMRLWGGYQDFQVAAAHVGETFQIPAWERLDPRALPKRAGHLEIKDLGFSYAPHEPALLEHVNLTLQSGEVIAISGEHSCGKTTLLKLIAGIYPPTTGEILVDGAAPTSYPAREFIYHVGFLPNQGIIFRGTIADNLSAFGEHDDYLVQSVITLLELDKEVKKLPAGYETMLEGTAADVIPIGVCQRIAIARALATRPRIILFDNADRALDKEGYNQVYRLLAGLKGKATIVLVSDDYNITRLADKHYVLAHGRLNRVDHSRGAAYDA